MTGSAIHVYPKDTRDKLFLLSVAVTTLIAWHPLRALLDAALKHEQNSHILLVLPIVVGLLYLEGAAKNIKPETAVLPSAVLLVVAGTLSLTSFVYRSVIGPANTLSLSIAALVFSWLGLVFSFYGVHIFKKCIFPLLFLLFLVPLPPIVLNAVTYALQYGSTRATEALFIAFGLLAQAASESPATIMAANFAPRMKRITVVIFPCLLLPHDRGMLLGLSPVR